MTLTSKPLAVIVISILFGGIFFSNIIGWWSTETDKVPATYTEGEFAGQANPADIRGSYTFGDVETSFGIPAALLVQAFGVTADDAAAFQVKSLEEMYADSEQEVGTASVRLFVAFYNGLPFDLSSEIYLPASAAAMLRERPLSAEQLAYLETHTLPAAGEETAPVESAPEATPVPAESQPAEPASAEPTPTHAPGAGDGTEDTSRLIKGKTTFGELLAWGVPQETVESILGMPLPAGAAGLKIKDFCSTNGLDFETIKTELQVEVEKLP